MAIRRCVLADIDLLVRQRDIRRANGIAER